MIGDIEHNDIVTLFGRKFKCKSVVSFEEIEKSIEFLSEESGCEKKDYRERYEKLTQSDTFKSSYCNKSLGKDESTDEANCITKSKDLEEASRNYAENEEYGDDVYYAIKAAFKAGAEWQKQKNQETICESNCTQNDDLKKEISKWRNHYISVLDNNLRIDLRDIEVTANYFAEWQKQQMMKNTVLETKVIMDSDGDGIETPYEEWLTLENTEIPCIPDNLGLKEGDKVKIIIVKTE